MKFKSYFKNKTKYGAKKTERAGQSFGSKLEAAVFEMHRLMQLAGEIKELKAQESVYLTEARIQYIADLSFIDVKSAEKIWAEAKGFETDVWRIKRRLWKEYGPGALRVYKGSHRSFKLHEEIIPKKGKAS